MAASNLYILRMVAPILARPDTVNFRDLDRFLCLQCSKLPFPFGHEKCYKNCDNLETYKLREQRSALADPYFLSKSCTRSTVAAHISGIKDLYGAGIEIEHARRREDQVELQPEPV